MIYPFPTYILFIATVDIEIIKEKVYKISIYEGMIIEYSCTLAARCFKNASVCGKGLNNG